MNNNHKYAAELDTSYMLKKAGGRRLLVARIGALRCTFHVTRSGGGPMKLYKIGQPWQNEHFYCQ
jgi:hypothetical protein